MPRRRPECVTDHTLACPGGGTCGGRVFIFNSGSGDYPVRVTVLDVIQRSADFLAKKQVEAPRLQAELLLAYTLKLQRMELYLNFDRVLNSQEEDILRQLVQRRGRREPLQHIVGSSCFCGLEITVNRSVLIPRPETELLAEQAWLFLNRAAEHLSAPKALDFGTGSGCVAIALAANAPQAQIVALDISRAALETARANSARNRMAQRIEFVLGDGLAALANGMSFKLIVSNPPYIPSAEIAALEPEVRDYDPRTALDGGPDGLEHYRHLAREAPVRLDPGGKLMLEVGDTQAGPVADLLQNENWVVEQILKDYTQRPRILIAHRSL